MGNMSSFDSEAVAEAAFVTLSETSDLDVAEDLVLHCAAQQRPARRGYQYSSTSVYVGAVTSNATRNNSSLIG